MISLINLLVTNTSIADLTGEKCGIVPIWIWNLINNVFTIIKIAIPILLVVLGSIDLGKAVVASDEKKVKEAQKALARRIGYGLAVFLLATVIIWLLGTWLGIEETCLGQLK